jgi:hypothetical protein
MFFTMQRGAASSQVLTTVGWRSQGRAWSYASLVGMPAFRRESRNLSADLVPVKHLPQVIHGQLAEGT